MKNKLKKPLPKLIKLDKTKRYQRLLKEKLGSLKIHSGHVVLRKNENIGEHITDNVEEMLIILEGKADIFIDKKKVFKPGRNTVVYIPPNTAHDVKNAGSKILRYIYVTSPVYHSESRQGGMKNLGVNNGDPSSR